jgi:hypothetical protein
MTKSHIKISSLLILIDLLLGGGFSKIQAVDNISVPLAIKILSAQTLSGTAGDFVTVQGEIKNLGKQPINNITTYLSLVDMDNKQPIDLEDWSAEMGLFIGTIDASQIMPLNWKVHFVKAGNYSLAIVANTEGINIPQVSNLTYFKVSPKHNLNPGKVLPVALGEPIIIIFILLALTYKRKSN